MWREEGRLARPQALRNNTMVTTLGFIFASYIPNLEVKKLANWKCQQAQTKKSPTKACSL